MFNNIIVLEKKKSNNKEDDNEIDEAPMLINNINKVDGDEDVEMVEVDTSKSIKELAVIAKSYNLLQRGRKNEIIERINKFVKEYREKREKLAAIKAAADAGSKKFVFSSKLEDLPIKDISNGELLFWKVFKNKVLFKNIASNFSKDDRFHSYDGIVKVNWMLENGYINLVMDKLRGNRPLIINESYQPLVVNQTRHKWYEAIFKREFKLKNQQYKQDGLGTIDTLGNKEFYQLLFKRFSKLIYCPKKLLHSAIKWGCLPAVQAILDEKIYQFEPESIAPPSQYNYKEHRKKLVVHSKQSLIISALLKSTSYLKFPIFQYIYTNELVQSLDLDEINQSIEKSQLLEKHRLNIGVFQFLNYFLKMGIISNFEFNANVYRFISQAKDLQDPTFCSGNIFKLSSLSQLINTCETFVHYKSDRKTTTTILGEIKTIDQYQLNQNQLDLKLESLLFQLKSNNDNNNNNNNNNNLLLTIKRLVDFYHDQVPDIEYSILYYLTFEIEIPNDIILDYTSDQLFVKALEYGNYELLILVLESQKKHTYAIPKWFSRFDDIKSNVLFKYCQDNVKKIKFIKESTAYLKSNLQEPSKSKAESKTMHCKNKISNIFILLFGLIGNDDVSMVQLFINEIGIELVNTTIGCDENDSLNQELYSSFFEGSQYYLSEVILPSKIHRHIKSTEMLKFCYSNFENHFIQKPDGILIWYLLGRIDLLGSFEELIGEHQYQSFLLPLSMIGNSFIHENNIAIPFNNLLKTCSYIVRKPMGMYKYNDLIFKYIDLRDKRQDVNDIINIIQYSDQSLKCSLTTDPGFLLDFKNTTTRATIKLFEWLFSYEDGIQIKSGRVHLEKCYYTALALTNRIDNDITAYHNSDWYKFGCKNYATNSFSNTYGFNEISTLVIRTGDIKLLDLLFIHYFTQSVTNECVDKVLDLITNLINNQWLHCIQYIFYKYNRFLNRKNNANNGLIPLENLKKLSLHAVKCGEYEIFNFFSTIADIPFTSKQFHAFFKVRQNEASRNLVYYLTRSKYVKEN